MKYSDFDPPEVDTIVRQYLDEDGVRIDARSYPGKLRATVGKVVRPGPIFTLLELVSGDSIEVRNNHLRDAYEDESYMWDETVTNTFGF